ncbi:diaminopimelate epimerase [Gemmiger sp.]
MELNFTKMQGAGNDYLYIDCRRTGLPPDAAAWAVLLSRRHYAVGADGVIYLCPPLSADGDATMRMFNADGSEGAMCGNGVRCAAEFLYTHGVQRDCIRIDTLRAGRRTLRRVGDSLWQAEMGRFAATGDAVGTRDLGRGPLLDVPLCAGGRSWRVCCVAVGNPHCVIFTKDAPPADTALAEYGRALEHHPAFPNGINVEFARQLGPAGFAATVWERGSGVTLACGTGACAVAAAAVLTGRCGRGVPILVQMPGGTLEVCVQRDDTVLLTGDAVTTFNGTARIRPCNAPRGVV